MHRWFAVALCAALLAVSSTARAEGMNSLYAAINGIVIAPTDPFYYTIVPPENFEDLPLAPASAHVMGLPAGVLQMGYRVFMAAGDLVFFPFWVFPVFSPEPELFTLIEVEYE